MNKRKAGEKREAADPHEPKKKKQKKPKKKRIEIENLVLPQIKLELPPFKLQNVVASKWVFFPYSF
jgi:hypothetical protein|tara:strand:+ start:962 stop:1159 length:198 start_codon:yes stop_codon:yes gene_type:complete